MKTTLEILENEIKWKVKEVQEGQQYVGQTSYLLALEGVLRQIKGLKDEEKRLIVNAYQDSHISTMTAEQYFNETFKKTEQ